MGLSGPLISCLPTILRRFSQGFLFHSPILTGNADHSKFIQDIPSNALSRTTLTGIVDPIDPLLPIPPVSSRALTVGELKITISDRYMVNRRIKLDHVHPCPWSSVKFPEYLVSP